jgi:hypothetical protein
MSIARKGVPCPEVLKVKLRLRTGEKSSSWGRKASEETKKLMSDSMKGKYVGEANPCFGRKHTDEERKQMSDVKRLLAFTWAANSSGCSCTQRLFATDILFLCSSDFGIP